MTNSQLNSPNDKNVHKDLKDQITTCDEAIKDAHKIINDLNNRIKVLKGEKIIYEDKLREQENIIRKKHLRLISFN